MCTQLSRQLTEAHQRVQRLQQLGRREAELREALYQETYRCETFETQLSMIADEVQKLESFGLGSLISGMLGRKQNRLDVARQANGEVEQELEVCRTALANLQAELDAVVPELAVLQGCRENYEALCAQREAEILACPGEPAARLKALDAQHEHLKDGLRRTRKTAEATETMLHSLSTAKISVRQVNKRKMPGHGLAGGMYNALMSQALRPSRSALGTALDKLLSILEGFLAELHPEGSPDERQLSSVIQAYRGRFAACPPLEQDCDALIECETETAVLHRALRGRMQTFERSLSEMAAQRAALIQQT